VHFKPSNQTHFKVGTTPMSNPSSQQAHCPNLNGAMGARALQVPDEAYEFNFVLHDNEGVYENNSGVDFVYSVVEGATKERWSEIQAERAAKRELERQVRACV